ncbi:MAG TPA: ribbon-helix-helix protein, CopG family, partial [Vicinamibacterales bacterium]|nr:ribbon-helix-helix protein, CopG family [Vicinamibacterales bacterium]
YPQVTIRLPDTSKRLLEAIVGMTGRPLSRVIEDALTAYVQALPADERTLLASIQRRRAQGD